MKYDSQIQALKPQVEKAESILITLAAEPNVDELASALALFLSAEEAGKHVAVVTEGIIRVGHTNLYGVGHIQNNIPQALNGNLTVVLGGVVDPDQQKPLGLQELKWHPEGTDLHLVFHPVPGKRFEPTHITPTYEGGHFDLIFVVGAPKLEALGTVYSVSSEVFSNTNTQIINIDNKADNANFGSINIVDNQAASVSEIIGNILPQIGLPFADDIATNVLTGIYEETVNLQAENTTAETFSAVAEAVRAGGKRPTASSAQSATASQPAQVISYDIAPEPQSAQSMTFMNEQRQEEQPQPEIPSPAPTPVQQPAEAVSEIEPVRTMTPQSSPAQPEPVSEKPQEQQPQEQQFQPSPEEVPSGEEAVTPSSDWLTPKIYRGGGVG